MTPRTLIFDVMSTLVVDPFFTEVPIAFGCSIAEFVRGRSRSAWPAFERNELTETEFFQQFFGDSWPQLGPKMRQCITQSYVYIAGVEEMLAELNEHPGVEHCVLLSNYPSWFSLVEQQLVLSRYFSHSFVSYQLGLRKPDPQAYLAVTESLGVDNSNCVFIDDRAENCTAATALGMDSIRSENVDLLRAELAQLLS